LTFIVAVCRFISMLIRIYISAAIRAIASLV